MAGSATEVWDYVDLLLLRMAKARRKKLSDAESAGAFYEEFFNANDVQLMAAGSDPRRRYRGEILRDAVWSRLPAQASVIDIGCGLGDNLRYVVRDDATFFGIEYSKNSAEVAKRILGPRADIRVGSATAVPFADETFDLALCIEVIEHIQEEERAFQEIRRVTKRGGHLVLSLPFRHWFPSYLELMGHFRHYTRDLVEDHLRRHDFVVVEHLANYPRWSRFANYAYIVARAYSLFASPFRRRISAADVSVPFGSKKLIDWLFEKLDGMRRRESRLDYASLETSTFVVARKL